MKIYDKTVEINDELKFELGCSIEDAKPSLQGFIIHDLEEAVYFRKEGIKVGPFDCKIRLSFYLNRLEDIEITPERYSYAAKIAKDGESKEETMNRCAQDIIAYVEQSLVGFRRTNSNYFATGFSNDVIGVGVATDLYYDYTISIGMEE